MKEGRKMKRIIKKLSAVLLCLMVAATMTPATGFAAGTDATDNTTVVESEATTESADKTTDETSDFAKMSVEEQYEYVMSLEDDKAVEEALSELTEEQQTALIAYAQEQAKAENTKEVKTVNFTDAGPFMPAVNVAKVVRKVALKSATSTYDGTQSDGSTPTEENGLILNKTAVPGENDGEYKITMEAYTTGEVTTTTKTVPVDIVLVLDQSGSMAFDFDGNQTSTNENRRQYAMKQAVNNFIKSVNGKYAEDADHRMSIVTFGSSATTLQGWTFVDDDGMTTLQNSISGLPKSPSGATNVAAGMVQAETLMGSGYNYTGTNTQRQKVVIVFTDGVPTTSNEFSTTVATNAIASAKKLKDDGCTVYSIGIFNGADPAELYGEKWDYAVFSDIECSGEEGSYWGGSWVSGLIGSNDFDGIDIAAGNRFLNYLSSNSLDATNIGLERGTFNPGNYAFAVGTGYKITENFKKSSSSYYLTANDSDDLNSIFQSISENIQTANIDLGSEAVIKDIVTPYFNMPENVSDIKLYTSEYLGNKNWANAIAAESCVTANKDGNTVDVTGFNFNENFISETAKSDGSYGKKLIIEFTVTVKDKFLGGNEVPTNESGSGVYDKDGSLVEGFDNPVVNVPVKSVEPVVSDKSIYLTQSVNPTDLLTIETFDGVNNKYVDILYTVKKGDNIVGTYTIPKGAMTGIWDSAVGDVSPNNDVTYTVECLVNGGDNNTANASGSGTIYVFKPEITYSDLSVYYGEIMPGVTGSVEWKHGSADVPTPESDAPELTEVITYAFKPAVTPARNPVAANGVIESKDDFYADVTVKVDDYDITEFVTFLHDECTQSGCGYDNINGKFKVHVKTCQLTITKTGGKEGEPYVFTVSKDGTKYTELTIVGNGNATIYELPVGTYTVTEDTGWSWRYDATSGAPVKLSKSNTSDSITITNAANDNIYWLNGYSTVVRNAYSDWADEVTE